MMKLPKMIYTKDNQQIEYTLKTNPPEATTWTTHQLKKTEIKIITKLNRTESVQIRQEIFDDIISREPNQRKKPKASDNKIQKRSKATNAENAKVGVKQQKTRRQNKSKKVEEHAPVQSNSRRTRNVPK
jgi:hypothetical protein